MGPVTCARIARDVLRGSRVHLPLALRDAGNVIRAARTPAGRPFLRHAIRDFLRFSGGAVTPVEGETLSRAALAAAWIARAQDATGVGGLSYGYMPCRHPSGWQSAYPETSGYTIPTLFEYARFSRRQEYHGRALEMAQFVVGCQLPGGGIYGGKLRTSGDRDPVSFNTGMVLLGLSAAYRQTGDERFLVPARRAAEFLVADLGADGQFRSHGRFVHEHQAKTYACLCAWPLWCAADDTGDDRFREAAARLVDAALQQQRQSGWFMNNCLSRVDAPLLHTIGYTLQGLLEVGILSGRGQYIDAVRRGINPLLPQCVNGFLHARWYEDWKPAAFSSCLTGSAQIAVVCYRLAQYTGDARYKTAADTVLDYLKAMQCTASDDPGIVGGIGGSFPLSGAYIRLGLPGWATKFFLDALMLQHQSNVRGMDVSVLARCDASG